MDDVHIECALEVFDFCKKSIYCDSANESRLNGLVNRGALVWLDDSKENEITEMKSYLEIKDSINFIHSNGFPKHFDYSIVCNLEHGVFSMLSVYSVKEHIFILTGILDRLRWYLIFRKVFDDRHTILYSVVPSIDNTKLVIPELFDLPLERYWTLRSRNPLFSLKLIVEWIMIKNSFLRKAFSDKLIVIKC